MDTRRNGRRLNLQADNDKTKQLKPEGPERLKPAFCCNLLAAVTATIFGNTRVLATRAPLAVLPLCARMARLADAGPIHSDFDLRASRGVISRRFSHSFQIHSPGHENHRRAIGFYRRNGFAEVGTRTFQVGTQRCCDLIFGRPLAST